MARSMEQQSRTALVFGASGITGWAIIREALISHLVDFDRVIGVTNRPFEEYRLSLTYENLSMVSGVDLTSGVDAVTDKPGESMASKM